MCSLADSVMDQRSSASTFSLTELRDLFTLDEETECQTHDLLGCACNGKGRGRVDAVPADDAEGERLSELKEKRKRKRGKLAIDCSEEGSSDTEDSLPESPLQLPGLVRASQVDMVKVEEVSPALYDGFLACEANALRNL